MTMDELAEIIEAQRKRRSMSMGDVNKLAFGGGNNTAVQNVKRGIPPNFKTLNALCDALDLEFYIGQRRETAPVPPLSDEQQQEYVHIPLHETLLAAGAGADNGEEIIDRLAFRRDWLRKVGVTASAARLARVTGDSMMPTLFSGDMVMIDTDKTVPPVLKRDERDRRRSPIYALADGIGARVKRIEHPLEDQLILLSDNPEYAPEFHSGTEIDQLKIIGKVVWWGHTVKE